MITKEKLEEYINNNISIPNIAKILKSSKTNIRYWFKKYNLPTNLHGKPKRVFKKCLNCDNLTKNPKFCSKSCSASVSNILFPKRKRTRTCKACNNYSTKLYCSSECKPKSKFKADGTIGDVIYTNLHKSSAFALIRSQARNIGKKLGFKFCKNCGYDKHYEVCHIKSISSFPLNTLIRVVNHPDNLIPLCPNCHYEHDRRPL